MFAIYEILNKTPWWIFILFFSLLKVGIDGTKNRTKRTRHLYIAPAIFLGMSLQSLFSLFPQTWLTYTLYIGSLTIGIAIGWLFARTLKLDFDHIHHTIKIPGSFMILILMMSIFFSKYHFTYSLATNCEILSKAGFISFHLIFSGLTIGLLLGRTACYLFRNKKSYREYLSKLKT
jgi:hypothetical protein